jgi:hypothetical protein
MPPALYPVSATVFRAVIRDHRATLKSISTHDTEEKPPVFVDFAECNRQPAQENYDHNNQRDDTQGY